MRHVLGAHVLSLGSICQGPTLVRQAHIPGPPVVHSPPWPGWKPPPPTPLVFSAPCPPGGQNSLGLSSHWDSLGPGHPPQRPSWIFRTFF